MLDILKTALFAACGAGIIAAGGYLKNVKDEGFDKVKFLKTIILAVVCSIGTQLTGLSTDSFINSTIGILIAEIIENWLKAIFRDKSILRSKLP